MPESKIKAVARKLVPDEAEAEIDLPPFKLRARKRLFPDELIPAQKIMEKMK